MYVRAAASLLLIIGLTSCGQPSVSPMPTATPQPTPIHVASHSPPIPTPNPAPTPSLAPTEALENDYTEPKIIAPIEDMLTYDHPPIYDRPSDSSRPMSPMPKGIRLPPNDQDVFLPADMVAGNLSYGMSQEQVFDLMGKPRTAYAYVNEGIGAYILEWHYANGDRFCFSDYPDRDEYYLDEVIIHSPLYGPRGAAIGDTLDKVMRSFRIDPDSAQGYDEYGELPLYAHARVPSIRESPPDDLLAPKGMLYYDDVYYWWDEVDHDYLMLYYEYPEQPYTTEEILNGESDYIYLFHYFCQFYFYDNELAFYRWAHGPHAY